MQDDVWYFVVLAAVAVVLCQASEIIQNPKILVDDVLFCRSCIFRRNDMQLLLAFGTLKDKFKKPDGRFSSVGG